MNTPAYLAGVLFYILYMVVVWLKDAVGSLGM
jgi:hypothetical protein